MTKQSSKKMIRINREMLENDNAFSQHLYLKYVLYTIEQSLIGKFHVEPKGETKYVIEVSIINDLPNFYYGDGAPGNDLTFVNAMIEAYSGDQSVTPEIDALYESVINKINGRNMFGVPVDIMNVKQTVVAAYLLSNFDAMVVHEQDDSTENVTACPYCDGTGEWVDRSDPEYPESNNCGYCDGSGVARRENTD